MNPTVRSSCTAPEPAETLAPTRPLELVDPEEWRRRRRAKMTAAIFGVAMLVSPFIVVVMNVQMAQRQIELQHLRSKLGEEQGQYETLREQVLQNSSPEWIVQAATSLGLVRAPSVDVVSVPVSDTPPSASDDGALAASDNLTRNKLADAP